MTNEMNRRTDAHRPVEMDPEAYEYLFAIDNQGPWALGMTQTDDGRAFLRELTNYDPLTRDRGTHQCHHCGARIRYAAFLRYLPTGRTIVVGEQCLDNRFSLESKAQFDRLRKEAALDRQKQRIKTMAREQLATLGAFVATALDRETDLAAGYQLDEWALRTVTDIRAKLWQYGSLSERQVAFVARLLEEAPGKAAERERRQAEREVEVKVAAPEGRHQVVGTIVSRKPHETDFGTCWKITVKCAADGGVFRVWMTEPSKLHTQVGDTIAVAVNLTRSADDESFAFGRRPTKASLVSHAA